MLNKQEKELLNASVNLINNLYDGNNHTVGCAVRSASGQVYYGVNMYMDGMNCVCAEQNAVGSALTSGVKDIELIVAVGKDANSTFVLSPCGQCRQFLSKYAPKAKVIIADGKVLKSVGVADLLPFAYKNHQK